LRSLRLIIVAVDDDDDDDDDATRWQWLVVLCKNGKATAQKEKQWTQQYKKTHTKQNRQKI